MLVLVFAAPWMLGSVQAWSELVLALGIGFVATIAACFVRPTALAKNLTSGPSLALGGLVLLGLAQSTSLPSAILSVLDPSSASLRRTLLPEVPEQIAAHSASAVTLPRATLSQQPGATWDATLRLSAAWLLMQSITSFASGYGALRRFGWVVALNATFLALFALIQALTWNGKIYWLIPVDSTNGWSVGGPFVCHTHLAEYLNVGLGFGLGFLLGGSEAANRGPATRTGWVLAAYVVGMLVLGIITSHSRGGFLAMVAASVFIVLWSLRVQRFRVWPALLAALTLLALFLLVVGDAAPYLARLGTILDRKGDAYQLRASIWSDVFRGWLMHPLWGTGLGAFGFTAIPFMTWDHTAFAAHAENEYVELLLEGGAVGVGLACALLIGVVRQAKRAWLNAPTHSDRTLVLGAFAGIIALAIQCLSDFGLHIPAIAFLMLVLASHLIRLGRAASAGPDSMKTPDPPVRFWVRGAIVAVTVSMVAMFLWEAVKRARCASLVASVDLPPPDANLPTPVLRSLPIEDLVRERAALEECVRLRPDWAEGHLRLGLANLALYSATADEWLVESIPDPVERAEMADPLWLLRLVHDGKADRAELLKQAPVEEYLVPAARSFLEARRTCIVAPLAHAGIGTLSFLFEPGVRPSWYVERVLESAGANTEILRFGAQVAGVSGDLPIAARCWRRVLQVSDDWVTIADAVNGVLSPDDVLNTVIPEERGHFALGFADRLYTTPEQKLSRDKFLRHAVARMPYDARLSPPERLWLEARARAELDDRATSVLRMRSALSLSPGRSDWRKEMIEWLIAWDQPEDAHQQALLLRNLVPQDPDLPKLLDRTAEAIARGANAPK